MSRLERPAAGYRKTSNRSWSGRTRLTEDQFFEIAKTLICTVSPICSGFWAAMMVLRTNDVLTFHTGRWAGVGRFIVALSNSEIVSVSFGKTGYPNNGGYRWSTSDRANTSVGFPTHRLDLSLRRAPFVNEDLIDRNRRNGNRHRDGGSPVTGLSGIAERE